MYRLIEQELINWSKDDTSLPIFLLGARQVGKTYTARKLAESLFKDKYLYINFLEDKEYLKNLDGKTSPLEIIEIIEYLSKVKVEDGFLLIFDEIQEIPSLKTSIKNFVERNIRVKIICLGSYLGNLINNDNYSFPVGKIKRMYLYPINFHEFLIATNNESYIEQIKESLITMEPMRNSSHEILLDLLHNYMIVGGMPKVVDEYIKNNNSFLKVNEIKKTLFKDYREDIAKYINLKKDKLKAISIYDNVKTFLMKENKKFLLSNVDKTARYLNYESAIKNLLITQIIYKIDNISNFSVPIAAHDKEAEFKIYYNDCGFVSSDFDLNKNILLNEDNNYSFIRGAIAENFVVSEILRKTDNKNLYYYSFLGNENQKNKKDYKFNNLIKKYEIDFVQEDINGNIIPIEVKFGKEYKTTTLNKIMLENNPKYGIVFSSKNFYYDQTNNIYKIPLYALSFIDYEETRLKLSCINIDINNKYK